MSDPKPEPTPAPPGYEVRPAIGLVGVIAPDGTAFDVPAEFLLDLLTPKSSSKRLRDRLWHAANDAALNMDCPFVPATREAGEA